ncbi:MAG: hypothetical protein LBT97_02915 [Planctomycetota bacterium]|nr:hypothetical protein [Planctomycetota bacterium]
MDNRQRAVYWIQVCRKTDRATSGVKRVRDVPVYRAPLIDRQWETCRAALRPGEFLRLREADDYGYPGRIVDMPGLDSGSVLNTSTEKTHGNY